MMQTPTNIALMCALVIAAGVGVLPAWAQCSTSSNCPASLSTSLPLCSTNASTSCTLPGMLTFTNQTTMSWPALPLSCTAQAFYDVAIGDLGCLHGTCSFEFSGPTCFIGNTPTLTAVDAVVPPLGQGYYYVVSVDGETWNGSGPGECVNHDALAIPIPTCP